MRGFRVTGRASAGAFSATAYVDRQNDSQHRLPPRCAVHECRFFYLERHVLEEAHQKPDRKGNRDGRQDQNERPDRVLQSQHMYNAREWDEYERWRHQVSREDDDTELFRAR